MPTRSLTDEALIETVAVWRKNDGLVKPTAREIGVSRATTRHRLRLARDRGLLHVSDSPALHIPTLPDEARPIDQLLKDRKDAFARRKAARDARKLIAIAVKIPGPIGICHLGDPHVDDQGCDIQQLEHDTDLIRETEGMFAATVGDLTNNWTGRLGHLWNAQSITEQEAWRICEWLIGRTPWLYIVGGNHDLWLGDSSPLNWIIGQRGNFGKSNVRINLGFPNGRKVRVNARHDFTGNSMWNPAHGPSKAAQMGWRDHILVCGHRHVSGYGVLKDPATGLISHCIRVASYKIYDDYAVQKNFPDQNISPNCTTIINPDSPTEKGLVQVFWDIDEAAAYLTWKRRRAAA